MKRFFILLLVAISIFSIATSAFAINVPSGTTRWVKDGALNFRSSPQVSSNNLIEKIPNYMPVIVLQAVNNEWSMVFYNGKTGYVMSSYLGTTSTYMTPHNQFMAFGHGLLQDGDAKNHYAYNLQKCLRNAGFYNGSINGVFDASLKSAVRSFQQWVNTTLPADKQIDVDGVVGTDTRYYLWQNYSTYLISYGVILLTSY